MRHNEPVKTIHIGVRVEPAVADAIDAMRESPHESRSSVVRRVVLAAAAKRAPRKMAKR